MFRFTLLTILTIASFAWAAPEVRFWVGERNNLDDKDGAERHLEYIRNSLGPSTVAAGEGALTSYLIYIPPADVADRLQFSEAALPIYISTEAYNKARAEHKLYGPLHFKKDGFDSNLSYSCTPVRNLISDSPEVKLASPSNKVAYDFGDGDTIDWQEGTVLIWVLEKKKKSGYQATLNALYSGFFHDTERLDSLGVTGHYARASEDFSIHFLHLDPYADNTRVTGALRRQLENANTAPNTLVEADLTIAKNLKVFADDWDKAISPKSAVNVQFRKAE